MRIFLYLCLSLLVPLAMSGRSLVVGLNAAYQKIITLPTLVPSSVNRASAAVDAVGGKGQNVVLASSCIGVQPLLAQFLGGTEGGAVEAMLRRVSPACSEFTVSTAAKTRTCITLIDERSKEATEIIEPSGAISGPESLTLLSRLRDAFAEEKAGAITIMGSAPPGIAEKYYGDIVRACGGPGTKVVIDSLYGVGDVIDASAAAGADLCVKVNARELLKLVDYRPAAGVSEKETERAIDGASILAAAALLGNKCPSGAEVFVCLTDGPFSAYLLPVASRAGRAAAGYSRYSLPPLPRALVNPIGAGDSVAAGLSAAWAGAIALPRADLEAAFRFGLACGMASCLTTVNAMLDEGEARALFESIEVETLLL